MYDGTVYRNLKHFCVAYLNHVNFYIHFGFLEPVSVDREIDQKKAQQFKLAKICVTRAITTEACKKKQTTKQSK